MRIENPALPPKERGFGEKFIGYSLYLPCFLVKVPRGNESKKGGFTRYRVNQNSACLFENSNNLTPLRKYKQNLDILVLKFRRLYNIIQYVKNDFFRRFISTLKIDLKCFDFFTSVLITNFCDEYYKKFCLKTIKISR
ncbi:MAG: hypothetical protein FJZ16_01745 [Candidatus Omnitrophica bacterium]|nr:hypothetical protein [Candidatus Omnitrophota bacterium]